MNTNEAKNALAKPAKNKVGMNSRYPKNASANPIITPKIVKGIQLSLINWEIWDIVTRGQANMQF